MVNWDVIDDVFLDMDGTLLDLHFDNYFWMEHLPKRVGEIKNLSADVVKADLHARYVKMRGTLDWYCLDFWADDLNIDIMALKREVSAKIQFRPNALELLRALSNSGKRVTLVSNSHRAGIDLKFEILNFRNYFDRVCSSHDYQSPKEDQKFWQSLYEDVTFDGEKTLFIDDNIDVLESAHLFGIAHLYSIAQPDLSKPSQMAEKFGQISCFSHVLSSLSDGGKSKNV